MGSIDLAIQMTSVDEQDRVLAARTALVLVEEPQRHRQRDGVEEVGADSHHHVDGLRFDEPAADFAFGMPGVACRVGHDEPGPSALSK